MLRKLVIIGSITALFVLTAAPAFGITLIGPDGVARVVLDIGDAGDPEVDGDGESNPAHGPICGVALGPADCPNGVQKDNPGRVSAPIPHSTNVNGLPNVGAWNAVFGPGGMTNTNTPICGVLIEPIDAEGGLNVCQP